MNLSLSITMSSLIIVAVTFAGGGLGLYLKNWLGGVGLFGGLRTAFYLTRYDAALEYYGIGARERRALVNELRANVHESSAEVGLPTSLGRLVTPRTLAAEVSEGRYAPSWLRGVVWMGVAGLLGVATIIVGADAFVTGFEAAADAGQSASWSILGWTIEATSEGPATSASYELSGSLGSIALLLIPFLLGARVWRRWTVRRHDARIPA